MTRGAELTKAQQLLLQDLQRINRACSESYSPAKRLVALGYATWIEGKYGDTKLSITSSGRSALARATEEKT